MNEELDKIRRSRKRISRSKNMSSEKVKSHEGTVDFQIH